MKRRSIYKISMGLLLGIILSTFIYGLAVNAEIENTSSSDGEEKSVPKAAADEYSNIFISKLQRTYKVDNYGLTRIKNKMILHNDRPTSLVSMKVCLSDEETDSLVFYGAFNRDNLPISMSLGSEKLNGYNVFDIVFDTPIHPYSNKTINVKYTLKEAFEYEPETSEFDIDVRVNPLTPYKIVSSNTQLILPSTSSETPFENSSTTKVYTDNNIPAFTDQIENVVFTNSQSDYIEIEELKRTIIVNPLGFIKIKETHTLISNTQKQVSTLKFQLPEGTINYTVKDDLGEILGLDLSTQVNNNGMRNLTFSLSENRARLNYGNTFYYEIIYRLPYDWYVSKDLFKNNLNMDLYTLKTDYLIESQTVQFEILSCNNVRRIGGFNPDSEYSSGRGLIIEKTETDITNDFDQYVDITFTANNLGLLTRGFIISLIILIGLVGYVMLRVKYPRKDIEETYTTIPIQEIRQYVSLYEEKNALIVEKEKADEDLIRRRIKKKQYKRLIKNLDKKIKELNEEIQPFKNILLEEKGKWSEIIKSLDYVEAEKVSIFDSVKLLEKRYKRGKLPSKAAYDRLSNDLVKRIDKAQNKIDRYINELRAFII